MAEEERRRAEEEKEKGALGEAAATAREQKRREEEARLQAVEAVRVLWRTGDNERAVAQTYLLTG
jgi:hypothetical protein